MPFFNFIFLIYRLVSSQSLSLSLFLHLVVLRQGGVGKLPHPATSTPIVIFRVSPCCAFALFCDSLVFFLYYPFVSFSFWPCTLYGGTVFFPQQCLISTADFLVKMTGGSGVAENAYSLYNT